MRERLKSGTKMSENELNKEVFLLIRGLGLEDDASRAK